MTGKKANISKRSVDALACENGYDRTFLWDPGVPGFGVVAFASGRKAYIVQYRTDGRSRRLKLGDHGFLTPDEARSLAKQVLGRVAAGEDPGADRKASRAAPALRDVAERFLSEHVATKRKAGTLKDYRTLLDRHVLPELGHRKLKDIRRTDIARLHGVASQTSPIAANRCIAVVSAIWNWAARRDEVAFNDNPVRGIERNREQRRERYLTGEELGRLGEALREAETLGLPFEYDRSRPNAKHGPKEGARRQTSDPFAVAAIRLLLLTGARLREILHARWDYIDLERGMLNLPDSKTGKKSIYLSGPALEVLNGLPRVAGNPFLFPGALPGQPRADLKKPWAAVCKAAKLEGLRLHDLRHSFASIGAGSSLGLPVIGKLLGHAHPSTTARYAHLDADPLRKAADQIGSSIAKAMAASTHTDTDQS
ncbi:MAG: tyrosine-type recombinase/integrase [Beijerinckiaceae bacterium]